jgi:hypothetical protein
VEVHDGDPYRRPTFKWSRDNGTVVARWLEDDGSTTPDQIRVDSLGRDEALGFAAGQWVELTDDTHELKGEPGTLALIVSPPQDRVLTLDRVVSRAHFPLNPKVRRWDMAKDDGALGIETGRWFPLEDGVQVRFGDGAYTTGDYWLIPARIQTGVEWPLDGTGNPAFRPPHGIHYHYCPLALLEIGRRGIEVKSDCRKLFPPITEPTLFYVSGDGQEATHDLTNRPPELVGLPKELVVFVIRSCLAKDG